MMTLFKGRKRLNKKQLFLSVHCSQKLCLILPNLKRARNICFWFFLMLRWVVEVWWSKGKKTLNNGKVGQTYLVWVLYGWGIGEWPHGYQSSWASSLSSYNYFLPPRSQLSHVWEIILNAQSTLGSGCSCQDNAQDLQSPRSLAPDRTVSQTQCSWVRWDEEGAQSAIYIYPMHVRGRGRGGLHWEWCQLIPPTPSLACFSSKWRKDDSKTKKQRKMTASTISSWGNFSPHTWPPQVPFSILKNRRGEIWSFTTKYY